MAKDMQITFAIAAALDSKFGSAFSKAKQTVASLDSTLAKNRSQMTSLTTAYKSGVINAQSYANAMAKVQAASRGAITDAAGAFKKQATAHFAKAASSAAMAGTVIRGALSIMQPAVEFEAGMSKVVAITRASADDMTALTKKAREMGATTEYTARQAADAMSYLGMAGWSAKEITDGLAGVLNLATAGGVDLARTADIVSDNLTAFGLAADQSNRMADVYATIITRTNTNVEMLGDTMKYAAPVAAAFGASLEETAAMAGIMASSGIKASQAGTALRAGFLRLAGPPKMAQKAMDELGLTMSDITAEQKESALALASLGISTAEASGEQRKMSKILKDLKDKTKDLGEEQKLSALKAIFGTEAATGWLKVLESGGPVFDQLVTELDACTGNADKMAQVMRSNAAGAVTNFNSAVEDLQITLTAGLLPAITGLTKSLTKVVQWLSGANKECPGLSDAVAGLAVSFAGLAVAGAGVSAISSAFAGVTAAVTAAKVAVKGLTAAMAANPALLAAMAISGLGYAAYSRYQDYKTAQVTGKTDEYYKEALSRHVEANAAGGIYGKGAFLTTFAEGGGESAIPHEPTARNIGLLAKTNEIMGNPLGGVTATYSPSITINGNASREEVISALDDGFKRFKAWADRLSREQRRTSYA